MRANVYGTHPEAALEAIRERDRRISSGDRSSDGRKLALVIEGGGMRGVYSAGALLALESMGLSHAFDEVYGTSAGAINAAYLLSRQATSGITIYYEDINNRHFINRLRWYKIADIDFVVDRVLRHIKPLHVDDVLASPSRLFIALMDCADGRGFLVDVRKSTASLLTLLKATSALPVLYNRPVEVDGRRCLDGGLHKAVPIQDAIAGGATDILVLLTRPPSYRGSSPGFFGRWAYERLCARGNEGLRQAYLGSHERLNALRDLALGRTPPPRAVNIATLCPDDDGQNLERTTKDQRRLKAAAVESAQKTLSAFGSKAIHLKELYQPFFH